MSQIKIVMFDLSAGVTTTGSRWPQTPAFTTPLPGRSWTGWVGCATGLWDVSVDVEDVPGERGRPAPFMIFPAMEKLDVQSVQEVIRIGDTPADMLEGTNAGCRGVIGVLSGPRPVTAWGCYRHTHVIPSVKELPKLIEPEFS